MIRRLFQWAYFRATGDIWSPSMAVLCMRPTLRWAWTGRAMDAVGPTLAYAIAEGFAVGMRGEVEAERAKAASLAAKACARGFVDPGASTEELEPDEPPADQKDSSPALDAFVEQHLDRRDELALRRLRGEALTAGEEAELRGLDEALARLLPQPEPLPPHVTKAMAEAERLTADPLEPYRAKASAEQRAACLHPPDDRQPLSGDGWLCGLCGADCAPPGALAEELTAERLDAVDQLAREPLVRASFAAAPEKILAAAVLALSAEVRRFHGVAKREQHERAKAAEGPLAGERLAVWVCRAGDCDREGASTYRTELQGDGWCENCGRRLHRSGEVAIVPAPPSRELEPGQRWLGAAGARFEIRRGQQAGTLRAVDQDGGAVVFDEPAHAPAHWTRLSPEEPAKPSRVEPGQAWTCVGVGNGGLLLLVASVDGDQIELEGPGGLPMVSASARNMLGLREWSFVRGPVPR